MPNILTLYIFGDILVRPKKKQKTMDKQRAKKHRPDIKRPNRLIIDLLQKTSR